MLFWENVTPGGSKLRQTKRPECPTETFLFAEKYIFLHLLTARVNVPAHNYFSVSQSLGGYPLDPEADMKLPSTQSNVTSTTWEITCVVPLPNIVANEG